MSERGVEGSVRRALERAPLYSEELGIDLSGARESECFKWFLASLLFGGHISGTIAEHTYRAFERHGLTSPDAILDAGWEVLVSPIMREGGYVRYDGRKSTQILRDCDKLVSQYRGRVSEVHARAADARDLEARLLAFFGVGPVTVNIFLRELRPHWKKADPEPLPRVVQAARATGVDLGAYARKSVTFTRVEAGLVRLAHRPARSSRPRARELHR